MIVTCYFKYFSLFLIVDDFVFFFSLEKLAEAPAPVVKKPVAVANINKWEGEDEDEVKVSLPYHI